ncbi:MAG TPA: hypothetical protein VJV78_32505 [Polyangiales bacterium]|nr:hypothetical protein [Polyangiales bacterium]
MRIAHRKDLIHLALALLLGAGCLLDRGETPPITGQRLEAAASSHPPAQPENAFTCALECADQHDLCLAGCAKVSAAGKCESVCNSAFQAGLIRCDVRYPPDP